MNNRIKNVLLIASVVFNLTLVGFLLYRQAMKPHPPHHFPVHQERMSNNRMIIRNKFKQFGETKQEFMKLLAHPEFNEDVVRDKLEEVIIKQEDLERSIGESLIELRREMTAKEAETFFNRSKRPKTEQKTQDRNPRRR